jgi:hypothetical protein
MFQTYPNPPQLHAWYNSLIQAQIAFAMHIHCFIPTDLFF